MSPPPAIPLAETTRRQPRYQPMVLVVLATMGGISLDALLDAEFYIYEIDDRGALFISYGRDEAPGGEGYDADLTSRLPSGATPR